MSDDSETRDWKCHPDGRYWKEIGGHTYCILEGRHASGRRNGYWFVRRGYIHGTGYVGEWHLLADAKRAAHKHAEEAK